MNRDDNEREEAMRAAAEGTSIGPPRWKDLGDEAPRAARLLLHAKPASAMTRAERARIEARLRMVAGPGGLPASNALPRTKGAIVFAVLAGLAGLAALTAATGTRAPSLPGPTAPAVAANAVVSTAAARTAPDETPAAHEVPSVRADALPVASSTPRAKVASPVAGGAANGADIRKAHDEPDEKAPEGDPLLREIVALDTARALLTREPVAALALLDGQQKEFAAGQLGAERELLSVRALAELGRTADARARGEAFMHVHGASPYSQRMERELAALAH